MNPPNPPGYATNQGSDYYNAIPSGPPPWSALAITAFVCSLIGFLGFTAVLGILLGIIGIIVAKPGIRRGRGLAIAAIPISVVMGLVGGVAVMAYSQWNQMLSTTRQVTAVLSNLDENATTLDYLFDHSTEEFKSDVSRERFKEWRSEVAKRHGSLIELEKTIKPGTFTSSGNVAVLSFPGRFVNGQALVQLHFEMNSLTSPDLGDLEVDGSSPRRTQSPP